MSKIQTFFFSNMEKQAKKQRKISINKLYTTSIWSHRLYVCVLCSLAVRFLLSSLVQYFLASQNKNKKTLLAFVSLNILQNDVSFAILTTSVAFFRNSFFLLCVTLVIGIALTVDWLLSTKYDSLVFRQSYDLLVINKEHLLLLNERHLKLTINQILQNPKRLISFMKKILDIWKGRLLLTFASPVLKHFDPITCTRAVRGKVLFYVAICEFLTTAHINGACMS